MSYSCFDRGIFYKKLAVKLKRLTDYFAHLRDENTETLWEHLGRTEKYYCKLFEFNGLYYLLEEILERLEIEKELFEELFHLAVVFHDLGKLNIGFQSNKMENERFTGMKDEVFGVNHSELSFYILGFIGFRELFLKRRDFKLLILWILLLYSVLKHHSSNFAYYIGCYCFEDLGEIDIKLKSLKKYLDLLNIEAECEQIDKFGQILKSLTSEGKLFRILNESNDFLNINKFDLFLLLKLHWSLLTAADYLATSEFINGFELETERDFGIIDRSLRLKLLQVRTKADYNKKLFANIEYYKNLDFDILKQKNEDNLNLLRQKLAAEVITNIRNSKDDRIFYIEAPTGAGKTNLSFLAAIELLEQNPELNKIYYVFPFTTLVTQTYKSLQENFDLNETEIAQIHSMSSFEVSGYSSDDENRYYELLKKAYVRDLFIAYPISLMTHVRFFDILKDNSKAPNYILHRLANSVVILDELQSYPPIHWNKIAYFLNKYAELLNIRFILMSATLPKFDKFEIDGKKLSEKPFLQLVPNSRQFFTNPNFKDRVNISHIELDKDEPLESLADAIFEKSAEYQQKEGSVKTIVEFIKKSTATEFLQLMRERNNDEKFFDEIFLLSGYIIEPRRKFIINYLKDKSNKGKNVLLVSTQVVEAGVDIDMDLGFKDISLLDSDEQLAGRVNRNARKRNNFLWLFNLDAASMVYRGDLRLNLKMNGNERARILQQKLFEEYYDKVIQEINRKSQSDSSYRNIVDYLSEIKCLNFYAITNDFKIIEGRTARVFVPVDVELLNYTFPDGKKDFNFSKFEQDFLQKNGLVYDGRLDSAQLWNFYMDLALGGRQVNNFFELLKILQSIISKLSFSVFEYDLQKIKDKLEYFEEVGDYQIKGFYKISETELDKIYSIEEGLTMNNLSYDFI